MGEEVERKIRNDESCVQFMQCCFLMLELGSAAGKSIRSYLTAGPIKLKVPAHSSKSRHRTFGAKGWFLVSCKPIFHDFGLISICLQMEFLW